MSKAASHINHEEALDAVKGTGQTLWYCERSTLSQWDMKNSYYGMKRGCAS